MPADVNVTEKVARAWADFRDRQPGAALDDGRGRQRALRRIRRGSFEAGYAAALNDLADPEVLAGIAGVIDEHGPAVAFYDAGRLLGCRGTDCAAWRPPSEGDGDPWRAHAEHVSAAVVEWLRGRA